MILFGLRSEIPARTLLPSLLSLSSRQKYTLTDVRTLLNPRYPVITDPDAGAAAAGLVPQTAAVTGDRGTGGSDDHSATPLIILCTIPAGIGPDSIRIDKKVHAGCQQDVCECVRGVRFRSVGMASWSTGVRAVE